MSGQRQGGSSDMFGRPASKQTLYTLVSLARQLAAEMAKSNFRIVTARPAWTLAEMSQETEAAITRLRVRARALLADRVEGFTEENWQVIETVMEASYRDTMATLLNASGSPSGETLR